MNHNMIVSTPKLRCPRCKNIFLGEVRKISDVFFDKTNRCPNCGYVIFPSEFEESRTDKEIVKADHNSEERVRNELRTELRNSLGNWSPW